MSTAPQQAVTSPSILLVDDNQHGLVARKALLEELGYRIETASSAEEALERFAASLFDIVVTDFRLPQMNGGQLIRKLKAFRPEVRVILLSGFVEPLALTEESTGADVVIAKSAGEIRHLIRSVTRLMNQHAPRKPVSSQTGSRARLKTK